ncbi:MAG: hypothetical protein LBO08_00840 [Rickettsiales bacterium]|nr:hypothetical protein [Rickettsiales bacterium]
MQVKYESRQTLYPSPSAIEADGSTAREICADRGTIPARDWTGAVEIRGAAATRAETADAFARDAETGAAAARLTTVVATPDLETVESPRVAAFAGAACIKMQIKR